MNAVGFQQYDALGAEEQGYAGVEQRLSQTNAALGAAQAELHQTRASYEANLIKQADRKKLIETCETRKLARSLESDLQAPGTSCSTIEAA